MSDRAFPFVWTRKARPAGYKGRRCRIVGKGQAAELCTVEFSNGRRFVVVRSGLRREP